MPVRESVQALKLVGKAGSGKALSYNPERLFIIGLFIFLIGALLHANRDQIRGTLPTPKQPERKPA